MISHATSETDESLLIAGWHSKLSMNVLLPPVLGMQDPQLEAS
jgi:hypothetical protein